MKIAKNRIIKRLWFIIKKENLVQARLININQASKEKKENLKKNYYFASFFQNLLEKK